MAEPTSKPYPNLEIVSGELTKEQIEEEAAEVSKVLQRLGVLAVRAENGVGLSRLSVADIADALAGRLPEEKIERWTEMNRFWSPDFTFFVEDIDAEFEFCHHNELHIRSEDKSLLQEFEVRWQGLGYHIRHRHGEQWELTK